MTSSSKSTTRFFGGTEGVSFTSSSEEQQQQLQERNSPVEDLRSMLRNLTEESEAAERREADVEERTPRLHPQHGYQGLGSLDNFISPRLHTRDFGAENGTSFTTVRSASLHAGCYPHSPSHHLPLCSTD